MTHHELLGGEGRRGALVGLELLQSHLADELGLVEEGVPLQGCALAQQRLQQTSTPLSGAVSCCPALAKLYKQNQGLLTLHNDIAVELLNCSNQIVLPCKLSPNGPMSPTRPCCLVLCASARVRRSAALRVRVVSRCTKRA